MGPSGKRVFTNAASVSTASTGVLQCKGVWVSFYQELLNQTFCETCPVHTQRFIGVLSASNASSCQCKEGTRLIPDFDLQLRLRLISGYYNALGKAGEVLSVP